LVGELVKELVKELVVDLFLFRFVFVLRFEEPEEPEEPAPPRLCLLGEEEDDDILTGGEVGVDAEGCTQLINSSYEIEPPPSISNDANSL